MSASGTTIGDVRAWVLSGESGGGDYFRQEQGHWLIDTLIASPMSRYPDFRATRTSWGVGVLGSVVVEIEAGDGTVGVATGLGGEVAAWLIEAHFRRFLVGSDPRDINRMWDQMYRSSLPYGRKGVAIAAISAVDLALWDLLGRLRGEPVWALIGGRVADKTPLYYTGPRPDAARSLGFWGAKFPLAHGPADGPDGLRRNTEIMAAHRAAVGEQFPLMVDCYMSLDVPYATDLAGALAPFRPYWIEEPLSPDDNEGFARLRNSAPATRWTTGEHEYTRYGFRELISRRLVDVVQPDMMWLGGLSETLRVSAMAAAYDIPVIPHGSGAYSYHFVASQPHCPMCEYVVTSPDGTRPQPVFGDLFLGETLPRDGSITVGEAPGFGLELNPDIARVRPFPRS